MGLERAVPDSTDRQAHYRRNLRDFEALFPTIKNTTLIVSLFNHYCLYCLCRWQSLNKRFGENIQLAFTAI